MKKITFLMVVIVAALLMSSLAFAQTYEKVIKMSEGTGEGMHKGCSQMGDVKIEKMVKSCGSNPGMMMKCGEMGHGAMGGMCGGMGCGTMASGCSGKCGSGEKMERCKQGFMLCCPEELGLTDEQVASLKSIKMNFMKDEIQREANLKLAKLELKELMATDKLDLAKVEKKIKSIAAMKADAKIACLKSCEKAKGILTPEQMEKCKGQHKKMKGM
ncbi:MAG: Spy/CpxP family protein refolding chaperone [Candidatus Zixiibacteriota bacterium]